MFCGVKSHNESLFLGLTTEHINLWWLRAHTVMFRVKEKEVVGQCYKENNDFIPSRKNPLETFKLGFLLKLGECVRILPT